MTNLEKILYIVDQIGPDEVLAQAAEEASELAQAALKYRRALTNKNPTPVGVQEAWEHFEEEYADTTLAYMVLNISHWCLKGQHIPREVFDLPKTEQTKLDRWVQRLQEAEEQGEGDDSPC